MQALLFLTKGYSQTVEEVTNGAIFEEGTGGASDMVVVRDIDIHSLCEHHMVSRALRKREARFFFFS